VSICDLLLGSAPDRARLANRLDEATRQLRVELAARWEANVELEAMRTPAMRVWGSVLGSTDGPYSLTTSMSMIAELLKGRINATAANRVC
jgi:hypothetical protein